MIYYMLIIALIILAVYFSIWHIKTNQLLKLHKKEWEQIKQQAILDGENISDKYYKYCEQLYINRGYFGACLPPR